VGSAIVLESSRSRSGPVTIRKLEALYVPAHISRSVSPTASYCSSGVSERRCGALQSSFWITRLDMATAFVPVLPGCTSSHKITLHGRKAQALGVDRDATDVKRLLSALEYDIVRGAVLLVIALGRTQGDHGPRLNCPSSERPEPRDL
jgi:hypothetical protein